MMRDISKPPIKVAMWASLSNVEWGRVSVGRPAFLSRKCKLTCCEKINVVS